MKISKTVNTFDSKFRMAGIITRTATGMAMARILAKRVLPKKKKRIRR